MADRHLHRHSSSARSNARPYGSGDARSRVAERAGAKPKDQQQADGQPSSSYGGQPTAPSAPQRTNFTANSKRQSGGTSGSDGTPHSQPSSQKRSFLDDDDPEESYDPRKPHPLERDPRRLEQRQKQIDLGKSTPEYKLYIQAVKLSDRVYDRRFEDHPLTPNKNHACSKRSWDGQVRKWRRLLHRYDDPTAPGAKDDNIEMKEVDTEEEKPRNAASAQQTQPQPLPQTATWAAQPVAATAAPTAKPAGSFLPAFPSSFTSSAPPPPASAFQVQPTTQAGTARTEPAYAAPATDTSLAAPTAPAVLFTAPVSSAPVYHDRLSSFDEADLDLLPPSTAGESAAHIDEEDLVDYEEQDEELEMQNEALAAARAL